MRKPEQILTLAVSQYVPAAYDGRVIVVRPQSRPSGTHADAAHGWRRVAGDLRVVDVPGNHRDIFFGTERRSHGIGVRWSAER